MSYFEDIRIGDTVTLGSHLFTAEEIIRFAQAYDPQPFHSNPEAARRSHFGALCASGWHTVAIWMRLMVEYMRREAEAAEREGRVVGRFGPSPGFRQLKWMRPVYAGEAIRFQFTVHAKRPLRSYPHWGLLQTRNEGFNAAGEQVLSFLGAVMVERRLPGGAETEVGTQAR
jgi:acyl dehydratase